MRRRNLIVCVVVLLLCAVYMSAGPSRSPEFDRKFPVERLRIVRTDAGDLIVADTPEGVQVLNLQAEVKIINDDAKHLHPFVEMIAYDDQEGKIVYPLVKLHVHCHEELPYSS